MARVQYDNGGVLATTGNTEVIPASQGSARVVVVNDSESAAVISLGLGSDLTPVRGTAGQDLTNVPINGREYLIFEMASGTATDDVDRTVTLTGQSTHLTPAARLSGGFNPDGERFGTQVGYARIAVGQIEFTVT